MTQTNGSPGFPGRFIMVMKTPAYLESWSKELQSRADRVRQLIGGVHWLSDGHHKEAILREFLQRYLPLNLQISRGFVRSSLSEQCSPEVDVLITDPIAHQPFFNEGGLQIVPPTSVIAYVEVKTQFRKPGLHDALTSIANTQLVLSSYVDLSKVWRSVFFFSIPESRSSESALKTIAQTINQVVEESASSNSSIFSDTQGLLPVCIATLSNFVVFIRSGKTNNEVILNLFETGDLSFAFAIADMFGSIRHYFTGRNVAELDDIIESMPQVGRTTKVLYFDL